MKDKNGLQKRKRHRNLFKGNIHYNVMETFLKKRISRKMFLKTIAVLAISGALFTLPFNSIENKRIYGKGAYGV